MLRKLLERSPMEGSQQHLERGGILMKKMLSVAGVLLAGVVFTGTVHAAEPVSSGEMDAEFGELVELVGVEGHCELSASTATMPGGALTVGALCASTFKAKSQLEGELEAAIDEYNDAVEGLDPAAAESALRTIAAIAEDLEELQPFLAFCLKLISMTLGH